MTSDKCACWANWQGPDCSQRTCAFDIAWATDYWNDAHYYAECSAKGLCDRETGECVCFEGYTGRACKRSVCPNDCSGHGKCRLVQELGAATAAGVNPYTGWDSDKIQACVCDGGFYGPDCSMRYCPMGDDPMTICKTTTPDQVQSLVIAFADDLGTGTPSIENDELALKFTDNHNETWWTPRISGLFANHASTGPADLKAALESIPNFKIPSVVVSVGTISTSPQSVEYLITFMDERTSGNQLLLEADFPLGCQTKGCQPMYKQLRNVDSASTFAAGGFTVTADSVLDGYFVGDTAAPDVTVTVVIFDNASSSAPYDTYQVKHTIGDGSSATDLAVITERVPDGPALNGIGYDHAPLGLGLFADFGSRTPAAGTYEFVYSVAKVTVTQATSANDEREDIECSGRGHCDVGTGNCACFEGYYGDHCNLQTILV